MFLKKFALSETAWEWWGPLSTRMTLSSWPWDSPRVSVGCVERACWVSSSSSSSRGFQTTCSTFVLYRTAAGVPNTPSLSPETSHPGFQTGRVEVKRCRHSHFAHQFSTVYEINVWTPYCFVCLCCALPGVLMPFIRFWFFLLWQLSVFKATTRNLCCPKPSKSSLTDMIKCLTFLCLLIFLRLHVRWDTVELSAVLCVRTGVGEKDKRPNIILFVLYWMNNEELHLFQPEAQKITVM